MAKKGPQTPAEIAARKEKEEQFFDKWMGRISLSSLFAAAVGGGVTAGGAVAVAAGIASVAIVPPIGGAVAVGALAFYFGARIVNHVHHDKKGPGL